MKLFGPFDSEFPGRILSHNTSKIKALDINHVTFRGSQHESKVYPQWSNLVWEALPSPTSLTLWKTSASLSAEPFGAAEEQRVSVALSSNTNTSSSAYKLLSFGRVT